MYVCINKYMKSDFQPFQQQFYSKRIQFSAQGTIRAKHFLKVIYLDESLRK